MAETSRQPSTAPPRWASYAEIERLYGLSRVTVWRLLKAGEVRAAKIGRAVRVDCESLDAYLQRQVNDFD